MKPLFTLIALFLACISASTAPKRPPNFVIVLADNAGYGDLGCFGNRTIRTPNLDQMAKDGIRFTDFYVAQAVCSASRTALLTGCYPNRVGILGALNPDANIGISDKEMTIAQVLKTKGYATAIYGKWHLGHHAPFLPTRHGFDDYFGLPYANNVLPTKQHPDRDLPLMEGEKIVVKNPDQRQLTTWYTEHAVKFIEQNKDKPFFLYVAHAMPHVPLHVSDKFQGKSKGGLYGDVIEELDWSVGEILAALTKNNLDENTLVMFTSDNGPWLSYGSHGGVAGPLREGKLTTLEGGVREPFIARWTGTIPAGKVCKEPAMTIDILPTLTGFAGAELPKLKIDGKDIAPLLLAKDTAKSPQEAYYFYWDKGLQAVRAGKWKLHFSHQYQTVNGKPPAEGKPAPYVQKDLELSLFDLENDIGETINVAAKHPEIVERLTRLADTMRNDLGDSLTKKEGNGVRPPGMVK